MNEGESQSESEPIDLKDRGYGVLFVTLLFYFAATPLVPERGILELGLNLMIVVVLVTTLRRVSRDRRIIAVALVMGIGAIGGPLWLAVGIPAHVVLVVATLSLIGFFFVVGAPILLDVYLATSVSFRTILGACSMFMVLGFAWFGIFALIELVVPDSFSFAAVHPSDSEGLIGSSGYVESALERGQLLYFSFVTITTLGFGDVLPVSSVARVYTTLGAVLGQLFLATMIARLVGIHSANRRSEREAEKDGD